MRVFGAKPPPVQLPQGRSGKFRTRFSPVTTGVAGTTSSRADQILGTLAIAKAFGEGAGNDLKARRPASGFRNRLTRECFRQAYRSHALAIQRRSAISRAGTSLMSDPQRCANAHGNQTPESDR